MWQCEICRNSSGYCLLSIPNFSSFQYSLLSNNWWYPSLLATRRTMLISECILIFSAQSTLCTMEHVGQTMNVKILYSILSCQIAKYQNETGFSQYYLLWKTSLQFTIPNLNKKQHSNIQHKNNTVTFSTNNTATFSPKKSQQHSVLE